MPEGLLIRLSEGGDARWAVVAGDGTLVGAEGSGPLEAVRPHLNGRPVTVLVPTADVLLVEADLPVRNRQRLLQALPYALEDSLAEEVEGLHFAVGRRASGGGVAVAAVARERLESWLAALREVGVSPERMVPDVLAVPRPAGEWHVLVESDRALVHTGPDEGFAADRGNLPLLMRASLEEAEGARPQRIVVGGQDPSAVVEVSAAVADLVDSTVPEPTPVPALATLARGLSEPGALDLLQGAYDRRASLAAQLRPWRLALALALVWLLVEVGPRAYDYHRLEAEREALTLRGKALFHDALPGAQRMVNPRVQMERVLKGLRQSSTSSDSFLALLAATGQVLSRSPALARLLSLNYRGGRLDLDVDASDVQALDRLKQDLERETGLQVEIQTANTRDGRVQSRLQLRRGGP